jgi:FHA domain-containing protein
LIVAAIEVDAVLLALKVGFLVLLYLFIWRIVRTVARDVRLPQESFMLAPQQAAAAGLGPRARTGSLVVLSSPVLKVDSQRTLDSAPVTLGRSSDNDMGLGDDEFASAHHARVEPRRDGVWVEDVGSTNGTFVNGMKLDGPRKLAAGDVIRVGETDLRFEV